MQNQRLEWLKTKMDVLFASKARFEAEGKDFNSDIQKGREYRNPRICEKLIETLGIKQYGTNLSSDIFDPDGWENKPEAYYDSRMYSKMVDRRENPEKYDDHHHHRNSHHQTHHSHREKIRKAR